MTRLSPIAVLTLLSFGNLGADAPPVRTALKQLDPVALVQGKEIKGSEDLSVVRGRYRYFFANEENKRTFEKSPDQYAVQIGGACAKMGPLSGLGSPDRFHVYDGKIYFFASDSCRNAFKAEPQRFIDKEDEPAHGTPEQLEKGLALIRRAVDGMGGEAKVDDIKNYRAVMKTVHKQQENSTEGSNVRTFSFPGCYREDHAWGTWSGADVLTPNGGLRISGNETAPIDDSVCRYMEREFYRHPLPLLKVRNEPGFRAAPAGKGNVGDAPVELVTVSYKGATSTLGVDPATGRVLQIAYRGRAAAGISNVVKVFSDFRDVNGITLPFASQASSDGKVLTNPVVTTESVTVNLELDPNLFELVKKE